MTIEERLQKIDEAYWRGTGLSAFFELVGRHIRAAETEASAPLARAVRRLLPFVETAAALLTDDEDDVEAARDAVAEARTALSAAGGLAGDAPEAPKHVP